MTIEMSSFPRGGLRVPRIGIGTSGFSCRTAKESERIIHAAEERGLALLDTADCYHDGESEAAIGRSIAGRRDRYILSTKFGNGRTAPGASRRSIRVAIEASLRRTGAHYIDLFQLHAPDPVTPIEETVAALQDLVRSGHILYYGFCNMPAWQLVQALYVARSLAGTEPISVQSQVSAVKQDTYAALAPALRACSLGLLATSSLARGLLGRCYSPTNPPPPGHALHGPKGYLTWTPENIALAARLQKVGLERKCPPAQIALALVLEMPAVVSAVVKPTAVDDLDDYVAAAELKLTSDERKAILHPEPTGTSKSMLSGLRT